MQKSYIAHKHAIILYKITAPTLILSSELRGSWSLTSMDTTLSLVFLMATLCVEVTVWLDLPMERVFPLTVSTGWGLILMDWSAPRWRVISSLGDTSDRLDYTLEWLINHQRSLQSQRDHPYLGNEVVSKEDVCRSSQHGVRRNILHLGF